MRASRRPSDGIPVRLLVATLSASLALSGCARLREAGPGRQPSQAPAEHASNTDPDVVCDGSATHLPSGTVEARSDGVHIAIENVSDVDLAFQYMTQEGGGGGDNADRGLTHLVLDDMPPGRLAVRCLGSDLDAGSEKGWAELEIADPHGFWVSPRLECQAGGVSSSASYAESPAGEPREPVEIAREFFDPQPADEVLAAGYPSGERRTIILVRDGRTIAAADYVDASFAGGERGSGWIEDGYSACDEWS